jgi:ParB/RepB/Spo0J family partition protein
MFEIIAIDKLMASEDNPRRKVGDVRSLAASISAVGILEPLVVTPRPEGGYQVVAGHRRLAAATMAGLNEVPCTVRELTEVERLEVALVENLARSDLRPLEEASALFRLVEMGQSVKVLAQRIGRSAKHISGRLALLELPPKVQTQVDAGKLTVAEATALLALKDHPEAIDALLADEWSRGDLERQVVRVVGRIESEAKVAAAQQALADEGVAVVDEWSPYGGRGRSPVALGTNPGELPVSLAKHRQEPCHAAHVGRRGEITDLCSDPSRHAPGGKSTALVEPGGRDTALDRRDERAAERRASRARREAAQQRAGFLSELAGRKLPRADVAAVVLDQFIRSARREQARLADELLGLQPATGRYGEDWNAALEAHASAGPGQRDRAALALALALGEEAVRQAAGTVGCFPVAQRHYEFLLAFGYEPVEGDDLPNDPQPDEAVDKGAGEPPPTN